MSRVCLIVDHPLRDLDGLVLVAAHLAAGGTEVFLVPMYQKHEVWLLRPDVVLLNYVRHAHADFIRTCLAGGIRVGVLDTEGGVRDFSTFADQVEPYLPGVSLYCVWGRVQFDALAAAARRHGVALHETGTPRYDFASDPWRRALEEVDVPPGPMVLVNTNFPLVNPRFQNVEREVAELVKMGWQEDAVRARVEQTKLARAQLVAATNDIARAFPAATVVVRPHPFEGARGYGELFAGAPNVRVRLSGSVFEWLNRAAVLVHHNCSTAIEAAMMGQEPIMIDWFTAPLCYQEATAAVSHRVASKRDLIDLVSRAIDGPALVPSPEMTSARNDIVARFFHANDGCAAARVAAAIQEAAVSKLSRPPRLAYAREIIGTPAAASGRVRRAALLAAGDRVYRAGQSLARRSRLPAAKAFEADRVATLMTRLARVVPGWPAIQVRPVGRADYDVGRWSAGQAVRLAAA